MSNAFVRAYKQLPKWQLALTGGLVLWAVALEVHIWSVRSTWEEKFADDPERLQREQAAVKRIPELPGDKLNISFQPKGPFNKDTPSSSS